MHVAMTWNDLLCLVASKYIGSDIWFLLSIARLPDFFLVHKILLVLVMIAYHLFLFELISLLKHLIAGLYHYSVPCRLPLDV